MDDPLFVIVILAILSVVAVLAVGIGGFALGGEFNRKYGNLMMRLRIVFQAIAVALILLYVFLRRQGG